MGWMKLTMAFESFWRAGLAAALFGSIFFVICRLFAVAIDPMVCVVLALVFWVSLALLGRRAVVASAQRSVQTTINSVLQSRRRPLKALVLRDIRVAFFRTRGGLSSSAGLSASTDFESRQYLDKTVSDVLEDASDDVSSWYGPVNALVWSIPAVGFVGMSWHLRVLTNPGSHGDGAMLFSDALPVTAPLASALMVVSSALLAAVVGYMETALAVRLEFQAIRALRDALSLVWTLDEEQALSEENDETKADVSPAAS